MCVKFGPIWVSRARVDSPSFQKSTYPVNQLVPVNRAAVRKHKPDINGPNEISHMGQKIIYPHDV